MTRSEETVARLEMTLSELDWLTVIAAIRSDGNARWRITGDDGFVKTGRITNWPIGQPRTWALDVKINIGEVAPGDPVLVGHVRKIERL
jgi:hypothetical protein